MAAEDDWSDSDEEMVFDAETPVQLGVPDGPIDSSTDDILDAAVSRIGGHPAFLSLPEPPFNSSLCKNCSKPMELLVQLWCPLEDSPYDRALYVWGCSDGPCQRKEGSVRAWRGLRFNEKYAAKLEKKRLRHKAKEEAKAKGAQKEEKRKQAARTNPFSMTGTAAPGPFGLGAQIFGDVPLPAEEKANEDAEDTNELSDDEVSDGEAQDDEDEDSLVTAMASTSLEGSEWTSAPTYPPLYMSTIPEYLPPAPKLKKTAEEYGVDDGDGKGKKDGSWALEGYENSLELDHVFERFTRRVEYQAKQCIRYELGGTPLPFSGDSIFDQLFPAPPAPPLPVTKPDFMVVPSIANRVFDPLSLPPCPSCNSQRVFECQLMPNLINVLKVPDGQSDGTKTQTAEERRKEVEQVLKSSNGAGRKGMEWGTCMIFSCKNDCCEEKTKTSGLKGCWREETVLIQWDV